MNNDRSHSLLESAHRRTLALIAKIVRQEKVTNLADADEQSAILTGVAAALAELMWIGRVDGLGVEQVSATWAEMGKELIGQAALHHMPAGAPGAA